MLIIRGLEVTQAIQYYRSDQHLTDPSEQSPDNSVGLIANKPAWVRVYIESDSGQSVADVSGTLTLTWGFMSVKFGEAPLVLNPQPPNSVTAQFNPDYKSSRAAIAATLNFIISRRPDDWPNNAGGRRIGSQHSEPGDTIDFDFRHAASDFEAARHHAWVQRPRSE